jgi:hypothetical protein
MRALCRPIRVPFTCPPGNTTVQPQQPHILFQRQQSHHACTRCHTSKHITQKTRPALALPSSTRRDGAQSFAFKCNFICRVPTTRWPSTCQPSARVCQLISHTSRQTWANRKAPSTFPADSRRPKEAVWAVYLLRLRFFITDLSFCFFGCTSLLIDQAE